MLMAEVEVPTFMSRNPFAGDAMAIGGSGFFCTPGTIPYSAGTSPAIVASKSFIENGFSSTV